MRAWLTTVMVPGSTTAPALEQIPVGWNRSCDPFGRVNLLRRFDGVQENTLVDFANRCDHLFDAICEKTLTRFHAAAPTIAIRFRTISDPGKMIEFSCDGTARAEGAPEPYRLGPPDHGALTFPVLAAAADFATMQFL